MNDKETLGKFDTCVHTRGYKKWKKKEMNGRLEKRREGNRIKENEGTRN
jgi:hypothetical protein